MLCAVAEPVSYDLRDHYVSCMTGYYSQLKRCFLFVITYILALEPVMRTFISSTQTFITLVAVDATCVKSQRSPFVIQITNHNCVIFYHSISHNYFFKNNLRVYILTHSLLPSCSADCRSGPRWFTRTHFIPNHLHK